MWNLYMCVYCCCGTWFNRKAKLFKIWISTYFSMSRKTVFNADGTIRIVGAKMPMDLPGRDGKIKKADLV
jgi:hypothetical protein